MAREKLPSNPEGAEQTGFLHGTRQVIKEFRAKQYTYTDKAGKRVVSRETGQPIAPQPGIVVVYQNPSTKALTSPQFYSNGSYTERVAAADGSGFELAEGSSAKHGLVKGSAAHKLLSSIVPLWPDGPKKQAALADYRKFEGAVVELVAMPVGKQSALANAGDAKTIAVVGAVVRFPWGANPAYGTASAEEGEDEAEEAPEDEPAEDEEEDDKPAPRKAKGNGTADLVQAEAQQAVQQVLGMKRYRRGIDLGNLAEEVGTIVENTKLGAKVLARVQEVEFLSDGPWTWDEGEQMVRAN